ncbi:MAG: hypothetical protein NTZ16_10455 [Verrucomicrobia bacterium]|nr:hypothetical protein [Verrucomicrobiota bacterium]
MAEKTYLTDEAQRKRALAYYYANRNRINERYKKFSPELREHRRAAARVWRASNKEKKKLYDEKWRKENPEKWKKLRRIHGKNSRKKPKRKLISNLRRRLKDFIKVKKGKSSLLFGCSPSFLRSHIEANFREGMSWENYGLWHVDHIRPCSSFDLTDSLQRQQCCHWSNLQPLWAAENIAKSNYYRAENEAVLLETNVSTT